MSCYSEKSYQLSYAGDSEQTETEKSLSEMGLISGSINPIKWSETIQPKKSDLLALVDRMVKNQELTNIVIAIGETTFNCHTFVLQAYSKFFHENINGQHEIILPENQISPRAFMVIYDWMTSSDPTVQRQGILEVYKAARYLLIRELVEQIWSCLDSSVNFKEHTAFQLYLEARALDEPLIMELLIGRISRFFLTLVASKDFLEFNTKELVSLLKSSQIAVHSETEVLFAAVRWLFYHWNERKKDLIEVMECIRFGLIPPWHLIEFERHSECPEIKMIMEDPKIKQMVLDGLHYVISKGWYGKFKVGYNAIDRLALEQPNERMWIKVNVSKIYSDCEHYWSSNYPSFLEYLNMLRATGVEYWRTLEYGDNPMLSNIDLYKAAMKEKNSLMKNEEKLDSVFQNVEKGNC